MNMVGLKEQPCLLFVVVLAVGLFSCSVQSMRFELQSGRSRCIAEDIKKHSMTVGNYSIVNPNEGHALPVNHTITVEVSTQGGTIRHHRAENVQSGQFSFVAIQSGDYVVCFWDTAHDPQVTLTIDFVWKTGVVAKDWSNIAKKSNIDRMAFDVQIMHETAKSIHEEIKYLRDRDLEMQVFNMTTNTRILWLSFVSFLLCFSVAGLQFWHLKSFFEKKKLI